MVTVCWKGLKVVFASTHHRAMNTGHVLYFDTICYQQTSTKRLNMIMQSRTYRENEQLTYFQ
jgi:hypothetical protein